MSGRFHGWDEERRSTHAAALLFALGLHAALGAWMLSRPGGPLPAGETPQPMFVALIDAPGPVAEAPEPPSVAEPPPAPQPSKPVVRPQRAEPTRPAARPRKPAEERVLESAAETALTSTQEATEAAAHESPAAAGPAPAAESAAQPAAGAAAQGVPAADSARPVAYAEASYLHNPRPAYPLKARRQREEGKVLLRVLVTEEGKPARVEIIASSGSALLDHAAREAVERWRFVAAKRGDSPVEATVVVPVVFKIGVG